MVRQCRRLVDQALNTGGLFCGREYNVLQLMAGPHEDADVVAVIDDKAAFRGELTIMVDERVSTGDYWQLSGGQLPQLVGSCSEGVQPGNVRLPISMYE